MNAGCYGTYTADVFVKAQAVTRAGEVVTLTAEDLNFRYRQTDLPEGWVITEATFEGPKGEPEALHERMAAQLKKRDETQPTKDRTAGSTFRNPAGFSSTGRADDVHDLKAWKVIDEAGMRGARRGGAQMSEKHSNFLINTGEATAADLEGLGEDVRKKVFQSSGIELHWEIMRVGEPAPDSEERLGTLRHQGGYVEQDTPESGGNHGRPVGRARSFAVDRAGMRRRVAGSGM
jgi:UDP-N-acetylmuramate dehydrogenase